MPQELDKENVNLLNSADLVQVLNKHLQILIRNKT